MSFLPLTLTLSPKGRGKARKTMLPQGEMTFDKTQKETEEDKMISKILVPTDGSKTAHKAVKYAIELARMSGATIIVLSVIDRTPFISPSMPGFVSPSRPGVTHPEHLIEPIEDYLKETARADMDEIVKLCEQNGVPSKTVIRLGHPVEAIIKEAEKSKVDLIVIGSHGRSALKAALLGSVSFGVIHKDTKIPVLVVRK
jgi:nucleotide-binding universal stress UspA family protein